MSNVIQLRVPSRVQRQEARFGALLHSFAAERRTGDDVFWLKENAEILNVLESTGTELPDGALASHQAFYDTVEQRMSFFPQYYRFLLSITLDLEALGMKGNKAEQLVDWAVSQDLAHAEMSDLQRMEARRLMTRRGRDPLPTDAGLEGRMRSFISRSQTFALPNKKAAYELTHAVFYLSEYGRFDPQLDASAVTSLHFSGLLAYLDQNADLLAEICVALIYAGEVPPPLWSDWLARETYGFTVTGDPDIDIHDAYHDYLVCNWHQATTGAPIFSGTILSGRMRFDRATQDSAPLREMSEFMFSMDGARSGDWLHMRDRIADNLSPGALDVLASAEKSDHFEAFFHGFARPDAPRLDSLRHGSMMEQSA
ncbi:hypothetical protein [Puniceibacterium sp. IMCC21224]|uniref:DUF6902 family protein n=1 Tax=Puniceibacterium sp. IMCC21224 TaxID=1618204 RepID=UPI00064D9288|nr:hypothetical protein [Puniceibacterium sp. IMCC21224]KMK67400.1 hypothetical protein IMCC21224_112269 [Puniceibacterium sp. IMCC21224]